jgi:translation initiation factor 3 subunit E
MAEWDLISKIGPYLDRHLVFPLLEFLTVKEYYVETDLLRGKLDLLSNTSMVDFAIDVHNSLYPDKEVPATLRDKRAQVTLKKQMPLKGLGHKMY